MKTLIEWLSDFMTYERGRFRSALSVRQSGAIARCWLRWLQRSHNVNTPDQLRTAHMESWQKHLLTWRTKKSLPLKPGTVNGRLSAARAFLRWLARRGVVPLKLADELVFVQEPRLLPHSVLDHAQVRKLLSGLDTTSAAGIRDRALLETLYTSGLRARELLGIDLEAVNFEQATALVMGKGSKERVVPLGKTALRWLENYVKGVRPFWLKNPLEKALWLNPQGQRLCYQRLDKIVHRHAAQAALPPNVTTHTFRRSCATELVKSGANLWHVKELLGHETLGPLRHYAALTITDLKKTHAQCHPREKES